jgi:hypothetical protein
VIERRQVADMQNVQSDLVTNSSLCRVSGEEATTLTTHIFKHNVQFFWSINIGRFGRKFVFLNWLKFTYSPNHKNLGFLISGLA